MRAADASAYFLQELAKLAAFGVPGAEVLFGRHHRADAASVGILSWAVHLPPLLGPDGLRAATQSMIKNVNKGDVIVAKPHSRCVSLAMTPQCIRIEYPLNNKECLFPRMK